jgi:hypothetical protein
VQLVPTITASCLISPNQVFLGGKLIFEETGTSLIFLDKIYTQFGIAYPKYHKMDNLCKLGFLAAEMLLKGREHEKKYENSETGLVLCNSHSSLDVDLRYEKTIRSGASPALFVYTLPNIVIGEISIRHHFKGENAFFVFKHFDGNFMVQYVAGLFENKLIRNCICGWVDFLKEDYRALLFLIETDNTEGAIPFTADNINKLNQPDHG